MFIQNLEERIGLEFYGLMVQGLPSKKLFCFKNVIKKFHWQIYY